MDILNRTEIVSYKLDSGVHDDVTLIGFIAENTPAELATEQHDKMDNTNTLSVILKAIQEIDNRIIPNTLLIIPIPFFPRSLSILVEDLRIMQTNKELIIIAKITFVRAYSALNDRRVVRVPAPAIIGNAIGTIDAVSGSSPWNIVTPRTISSAIKKITIAPATAKELMSIPMRFKISSPKNKKPIIMIQETIDAFPD